MNEIFVIKYQTIPSQFKIEGNQQAISIGEVKPLCGHPTLKNFLNKNRHSDLSFVRLTAGESHALHCHSFDSLVILTNGQGFLISETNNPRLLEKGDVIGIPAGQAHGFHCTDQQAFEALSIQTNAAGFYNDPTDVDIIFIDKNKSAETQPSSKPNVIDSFKKQLFAFNQQCCHKLIKSKFFYLISNTDFKQAKNQKILLKNLRLWSDKFQKILLSRQVFTNNFLFETLFQKHLIDELGHNDLLPENPVWDTIIDSCGDWFILKMMTLDSLDKLAIVHLVLEQAGDVAHQKLQNYFQHTNQYIDTHAEHDHCHAQLGSELFDAIDESTYWRLHRLCHQAWEILTLILNQIAKLSQKEMMLNKSKDLIIS